MENRLITLYPVLVRIIEIWNHLQKKNSRHALLTPCFILFRRTDRGHPLSVIISNYKSDNRLCWRLIRFLYPYTYRPQRLDFFNYYNLVYPMFSSRRTEINCVSRWINRFLSIIGNQTNDVSAKTATRTLTDVVQFWDGRALGRLNFFFQINKFGYHRGSRATTQAPPIVLYLCFLFRIYSIVFTENMAFARLIRARNFGFRFGGGRARSDRII